VTVSGLHADFVDAGSVCALIVGLLFLGVSVHALRVLVVGMRGSEAMGHVEVAREAKYDKYGDPISWNVTMAFRAEIGDSHREIRFTEEQSVAFTKKQEVTVHYSPKRPDASATIKRPRASLAKASAFLALTAFCFWLSTAWVLKL